MIFGVPVIRRYDLFWRLIKSLEKSTLMPDRIVVVDNGDKLDETRRGRSFPAPDTVIYPHRNVGCSGAWNLIMDAAGDREEFVIIANDDMDLHPESLELMVKRSRERDGHFVAGYGFSLFGIRRARYSTVGPFDENFYPAYFEDNDYTYRMKLLGLEYVVIDAKAEHVGSASLRALSDAEQAEFGKRFDQLRLYYGEKWGGPPEKERYKKPFNGRAPNGWKLRPQTE